ncbi:MAG TPA: hypothetical protein IAB38_07755 [Candidatus Onthousia excrementipullorum]|uniref:Uncharacterized protein n=1 Tax=Candidatus Onthousia excrementipullorum TaxID=2840884 RepID=A0A9D1DVT0_9FIRM|nr:hypothetical protein [Candidatus Onthousia excrementipullorum]
MKKLLLETSFSKIYMIVMIIITLLLVGVYFSYAMFTVSKEKSNAISIVTGNLTYKLEVDGEESNKLVVPSGITKKFIVTLSNPNNRKARFNFYYLGNLKEGVDTGYIEENGYNITPVETGVNLEKDGTSGSSNTYIIRVSNITDEEITINLGVSVGLDYNDLELPDNGYLFTEYSIALSNKLLSDKTNNLNYEDSEQTFITGENPNNYIWYSGKLWRAVSIDTSDKSVKMVTEWCISSIAYNTTSNTAFAGSYMEDWLNDTTVDGFLGNLRDYKNFIKTDSKWNATIITDTTKPPKTTIVTDAIGLLNIYEYIKSYTGTTYEKGYLNNGLNWWTLTSNGNNMYTVNRNGETETLHTPRSSFGIRPVINIKKDVKVASGSGTKDDPYRLKGDNDSNLSGTLLNTRYSGEYIKFGTGENSLYRIVSHETPGLTKVTTAEPLKSNGEFETLSYEDGMQYSTNTEVGNFLNNSYLNPTSGYFTNTQINMIEDSTTWYLGKVEAGTSYKLAKYNTVDMTNYTVSTNAKVGLLRYGELMASQFDRYDKSIIYGTLTVVDETYLRVISEDCNAYDYYQLIDNLYGVKPTFNLKFNVVITSGDGTKERPFELGSTS